MTLSDRIHGKSKEKVNDTILNAEEETAVVNYVKYLSQQGFPLTRDMLRTYIVALYKTNGREPIFNIQTGPSDKWFRGFINKHNQLAERLPETQDRARSRMSNKTVMDQYFDLLDSEIKRLDIEGKPERIFNCDETGWNGKEVSRRKVIGVKGQHSYQQKNSLTGHITAHLCVAADGRVLPTFLIFQKCRPYLTASDGVPGNWVYGESKSGYMDSDLFSQWFRDVFIPNCGSRRPVLLCLDNHDTHTSMEVIKIAAENNVTLLGLPPHTTHLLQPLDVSLIGPLKQKFQDLSVRLGYVNKHKSITKSVFPTVLAYAIDQTMTLGRVKGAFKKAGLYPVSRDAIDDCQLVSSHIQVNKPTTTDSETANTPSTSKSTEVKSCPSCGKYVGLNPLVLESMIPEGLSEIVQPVPGKPQPKTRTKMVTEARILTCDEFIKRLEQKEEEKANRTAEIEKRRQERLCRKESQGKGKGKGKSRSVMKYICEKCNSSEPEDCADEEILWVQCECSRWYHIVCVDIEADEMHDVDFVCDHCKK